MIIVIIIVCFLVVQFNDFEFIQSDEVLVFIELMIIDVGRLGLNYLMMCMKIEEIEQVIVDGYEFNVKYVEDRFWVFVYD